MKRFLLLLLFGFSLLALETFRLPNGMKIILINRNIPSVFLTVFYRAGSSFDPEGERGLSYLTAMMSLTGTRRSAPWEQIFFLERVGGNLEVKIDRDFVVFKSYFPRGEFPLALWYEHERMKSLNISEDFFARERKRLGQEVGGMLMDEDARIDKIVKSFLYSDSPYADFPLGTPEELQKIPLEHVKNFHRKFFQPRTALMVIIGAMRPKERNLILKMFSPIKSRPVIFPEKIEFPTRAVDRKLMVRGLNHRVYALCYRVSSPSCTRRVFLELVRLYLQRALAGEKVKRGLRGDFEVKVHHLIYSSSLCVVVKGKSLAPWESSLQKIFTRLKTSPPGKSVLTGLKLSLIRSIREQEIDPSLWGEVLGKYNLVFRCTEGEVLGGVSNFSPSSFWETVRKVFYPFNRVRLILLPGNP